MNIVKYLSLFVWAIILFGIGVYLISQFLFKKKKPSVINMSMAIYLSLLLLSIGILFTSAIESISTAFDNSQKLYQRNYFFEYIKSASSISIFAIITFVIAVFSAKFLSMIIFGNRKEQLEFESDNRAYAMVLGVMVLSICLMYKAIAASIFLSVIPSFSTPFQFH